MIGETRVIGPGDEEWPAGLSRIPQAPDRLYLRGRPLAVGTNAVAVVGTRRPTASGVDAARTFSTGLVHAGFTIVSGLAMGIDAISHKAALESGGYTIAVLGCGLDLCYPKQNARLKDSIEACGTLVSEHPDGTAPRAGHFPLRNRIIAALSAGVLIVEGAERSGARITAMRALDFDKSIFAVPGSIRNPMAATPNELIRTSQASLVTSVKHITDELAPSLIWEEAAGGTAVSLGDGERAVLGYLDDTSVTIDEICEATAMNFGEAALALSRLEVRGLVGRGFTGYQLSEGGVKARASL